VSAARILVAQIVLWLAVPNLVKADPASEPRENVPAQAEPNESPEKGDFLDMSLEELMNVEVRSTAALTQTTARMAPAAVTTITREQIQASGARSLFELLDIYVPNLQWIRHHGEADHLGLRGIISDTEDKYLLLVNGRVMNERTHYGAMSERDLVLLSDIHHIDVIRGPGSALYGPGAVSMVIDIITDNAETSQGTEVAGRAGAVEEFYSGEFKHGQKFGDGDGGVFLYAGAGEYRGADPHDAPQVFAFDLPGSGIQSGEPYLGMSVNRDGASARNLPPMKLHAEVTRGNWDIWARYTRGGQQFVPDLGDIAPWPYGWSDEPSEYNFAGYQQATAYAGYKRPLSDNVTLDCAVSYDMFDFARFTEGSVADAHREDEYFGRALLHWDVSDRHKISSGVEVSHEEFGLPSLGWPHVSPPPDERFDDVLGVPMPRWSTTTWSFLGEHQWTISDRWSSFVGARVDNNPFTGNLFSPRAALVHTPTTKDTVKIIWARSLRSNFAEEMKAQDMTDGLQSTPERLSSAELRYERKQNKSLDLAGALFYLYDLEVIGWTGDRSASVGTQRQWGMELEAYYHTERDRLSISHSFTQLDDFELLTGMDTLITAYPYGGAGIWPTGRTTLPSSPPNTRSTTRGPWMAPCGFTGDSPGRETTASTGTIPTGRERASRPSSQAGRRRIEATTTLIWISSTDRVRISRFA
jgi:outer membrane receptor protein involved in Fe transport